MLRTVELTKHYGDRRLFAGLSWQVKPGDRVGLVGPNGAGKTTLLRLIAAVEPADGGTVSWGREETVGYLPQEAPRVQQGSILERLLDADVAFVAARRRLQAAEAALGAAPAAGAAARAAELAESAEHFRAIGGYGREAQGREILCGLGFAAEQLAAPLASLSGGWWMRVELARLLLMQPSYLLLDEPTNHLDLDTLGTLERFLSAYPGAYVVVSHDRYFLNRMVTSVAELRPDGMLTVAGNYDHYLQARAALGERQQAASRAFERRVAHLQQFVDRFRYRASKAAQVQSRIKAMDRLAAPPPADAARGVMRIALPEPPRSGEVVLVADGVCKGYGDTPVCANASLQLARGEKVAMVGANGAGKSTLLKVLAGALAPDAGVVSLGHNVSPYYFAQHQLALLDGERTVLAQLQSVVPAQPAARLRSLLGAFLFSKSDVDKKVAVLSGGEKCRLALAQMLAQPHNLLLLDEPTNHLDMDSRAVLEEALRAFAGTIIFVTHDRHLINALASRVLHVAPGRPPTSSLGNYDDFLARAQQQQAPPPRAGPAEEPASAAQDYHGRREQRRAAERASRQAAALEAAIAQQEARLHEVDALLCDAAVYTDLARSRPLLDERQGLAASIEELYERWGASG